MLAWILKVGNGGVGEMVINPQVTIIVALG